MEQDPPEYRFQNRSELESCFLLPTSVMWSPAEVGDDSSSGAAFISMCQLGNPYGTCQACSEAALSLKHPELASAVDYSN